VDWSAINKRTPADGTSDLGENGKDRQSAGASGQVFILGVFLASAVRFALRLMVEQSERGAMFLEFHGIFCPAL